MNSALVTELLATLDAAADRPVIIEPSAISGAELARRIRSQARAFEAAGIAPGEPVALFGRPGVDTLVAFLAMRAAGIVVVLPDPSAAPAVTLHRLRSAGVRLTLMSPLAVLAASVLQPLARRRGVHIPALRELRALDRSGDVIALGRAIPGLSTPLSRLRFNTSPVAGYREADAAVIPTSGTTVQPKSVVHTETSLTNAMRAVATLVAVAPDERILCGTFFAIVPALLSGAQVMLTATSLKQRRAQLERCDVAYLTPPELRALLACGARFDGTRVFSGSAPVTHTLLTALRVAGASAAYGVYALTEIIPVAAVEADQKASWAAHHQGDLLGHLLPGVEMRIDDDRLFLRSGSMADRYLGGEPLTWIDTGDLAAHDDEHGLVLLGRSKEMILRRTQNIYPGLYEPALHCRGVASAILIGVPDGDGEELVVAYLEPNGNVPAAEIAAQLRSVYATWGEHRPDVTILASIPLAGRSKKPDRAAAAALARQLIDGEHITGASLLDR